MYFGILRVFVFYHVLSIIMLFFLHLYNLNVND